MLTNKKTIVFLFCLGLAINVNAQQSLENLDVLTEKFQTIETRSVFLEAVQDDPQSEPAFNYSLSPLLIDADGTRIAGASFGVSRGSYGASSRYLNIEGGINQYLLRLSKNFEISGLPAKAKLEFKDTDRFTEQYSLTTEISKVYPEARFSATLNVGWRERSFDLQREDVSDIIASLSVAKLFDLGSLTLGLGATYSPENDLDESSFVVSAQIIGSGFYLELDDDDTIVLSYRFSWEG